MLTGEEIAKHRSAASCWVVIDGKVYDVTSYLGEHPGGPAILLRQGGTDATAEFSKIHSPDILEYLPKGSLLGTIDATTSTALPKNTALSESSPSSSSSTSDDKEATGPPHIATMAQPNDFEAAAKIVMPHIVYTFTSSSSHDGSSHRGNLASWQRIRFRPQIFMDVASPAPQTQILGFPSAFPFYMAPMGAMGRAHPGNEIATVRALARRGIHGVTSSESTSRMEDIAAAFADEKAKIAAERSKQNGNKETTADEEEQRPEAQLHFQLYVPGDKAIAAQRIRRARATGVFKSIWVTVDTPVLGKRTGDRRLQAQEALALPPAPAFDVSANAELAAFGGLSHIKNTQFNQQLTWADLEWIVKEWGPGNPVVLKGVQSAADAKKAADAGCAGICLSNHGGRQMHNAPDALTTLLEIRAYYPRVLDKLQVFVDGGCRDGADVLKAVCLGATAVGIGRPFFYALGAYGGKGVERCCDLYADELVLGMRLGGILTLEDAQPDRVNASSLVNEIWRPEKSLL
ncbi:mitochondrial cytochrome-like protein b2 [Xylariaceae sp. FL0255]|nr:mitochondrial cytochrome-like protein b2 [Xylariaceae sp. FL0255]